MEKQKICIIGGGLTGIITALSLSKLNLDIDLIAENINKNIPSSRTLAISQDNLDFLKNMNSLEFNENKFWPCEKMELYTNFNKNKFSQIFNLEEKEIGISPGQACVFYSKNKFGDKVLGGGWITKTVNKYLST